jgi:hypothetical protein
MRQTGEIFAGRRIVAVVVDDDDLVVSICRARERVQASREEVALIPGRDDEGDARAVIVEFVGEDADAGAHCPVGTDDAGAAAAARERLGHRALPGDEGGRLRRAGRRGGTGQCAPVVEHERHVHNPSRALGGAGAKS